MSKYSYWKKAADGIYLVKLPLPFALNHVNCYLLQDGNGWTIVDTGLNIPPVQTAWKSTLKELNIKPNSVKRIILTHAHPDHYGLAGWLQNFCGSRKNPPPIFMSAREAEFARQVWVLESDWYDIAREFFYLCGLSSEMAQAVVTNIHNMRIVTSPPPTKIEILQAGETVQIGQYNFEILQADGHSEGQLIFYDSKEQLLLCGDHVLMKITPNIGLWPGGALSNPLKDYLASLSKLKRLNVKLALPGHGLPITDWFGRLTELEEHHAERLKLIKDTVYTESTAYKLSTRLFDYTKFGEHEIQFAVTETLSHLEFLVEQKQLERKDNGVWLYNSNRNYLRPRRF